MSERRVRIGWWLSSEEHGPAQLVRHAAAAEDAGVESAMVSDHLHPWATAQGHAGHVWTTIGAIAQATDRLEIGTGVVAMVYRSHPIVVAHAAATAAVLLDGRFFLGVGTGERANEQPFAGRWPRPGERRQWLADALTVLRRVWSGSNINVDDGHWRVENLRLFERPATPPPIYIAASGRRSAQLAGEYGDGLISVTPDAKLVDTYHGSNGAGPTIAQLHICLARTDDDALDAAWQWWPNGAVPPPLLAELARPEQFEAAAEGRPREAIRDTVVCATGAASVIAAIDRFVGAGYDTIYLHQIGPDQQRLADLLATELLPHYAAP